MIKLSLLYFFKLETRDKYENITKIGVKKIFKS